jgi:hypothetical protein
MRTSKRLHCGWVSALRMIKVNMQLTPTPRGTWAMACIHAGGRFSDDSCGTVGAKRGRLASTVDQTDRARQFLARYELDKSRRQIE